VKISAAQKTIEIVSIAVLRAGAPVVIAIVFIKGAFFSSQRKVPTWSVTQSNVLERVPRICAQFWVLQKTPILFASIQRYMDRTPEFTRRPLMRVTCLPESSREQSYNQEQAEYTCLRFGSRSRSSDFFASDFTVLIISIQSTRICFGIRC
jgi:hypothetical protein